MKLVKLEVRNYRSIKEQTEPDCVVFTGVDCLVGENNAGKSNILNAIEYLVDGQSMDESLFYGRDKDKTLDVRGYFEVEPRDFERLKIENKRDALEELTLKDGTIGVCRRNCSRDLEVIRPCPVEPRLRKAHVMEVRDEMWEARDSGADFREKMKKKFPELIPYVEEGKETNKSEWAYAHERFLSKRPKKVDFELQPGPPPQGISADVKNLLPKVLLVPAVKEVTEATKTSRRAELGGLLDAVSEQIQEELDEAIDEAMEDVYKQLNRTIDDETKEVIDDRHESVRLLEDSITGYVQQTFTDHSVHLEFPNPDSNIIFDNARVWVEEKGHERVLVENTGQGVKRMLVFSLIRTLADLRQDTLQIGEEETDTEHRKQPILLLYEEAELFLHPGLQRVLKNAFKNLNQAGEQVIYSTHSPFMVPEGEATCVNLVRKTAGGGTKTLEVTSALDDLPPNKQSRIRRIQNLSSFIFADRVLLVEGHSDRIVVQKMAKALEPEWDFVSQGIPVLPIMGKGNLPLFRSFLRSIDVRPFVLTDLDAVLDTLSDFSLSDEATELLETVKTKAGQIAQQKDLEDPFNSDDIEDIVKSYDWADVMRGLRTLYESLETGEEIEDRQKGCLKRLLSKKEVSAKRKALKSEYEDMPHVLGRMRSELLNEDVCVLMGDIEDYCPNSGGNKIEAALEFESNETSRTQLEDLMHPLSDESSLDIDVFLDRIFE